MRSSNSTLSNSKYTGGIVLTLYDTCAVGSRFFFFVAEYYFVECSIFS